VRLPSTGSSAMGSGAVPPGPSCAEVTGTVEQGGLAGVRAAAARWRRAWLQAIGAPDYRAYLADHAQRHPGAPPMSERDYVAMFIEHRYGGGRGFRCC
jgi:uncharacterized short protein YbdD (DUF466 family)